jgi:hypothetical protein
MKMPNGGFNPAYNVQFASDPGSRARVEAFFRMTRSRAVTLNKP